MRGTGTPRATIQQYRRGIAIRFGKAGWNRIALTLQFDLGGGNRGVLLVELVRDLRSRGLMDNAAVAAGEWWRPFTATLLHADIAHLAANATTGILILGLAMGFYGAEVCLLATYLAGVAGNLAGFMIYGGLHRSLGASGVVMGGLGLLTVQSFFLWRKAGALLSSLNAGVGGCLLVVLLGPEFCERCHQRIWDLSAGAYSVVAFLGRAPCVLVCEPCGWCCLVRADATTCGGRGERGDFSLRQSGWSGR